MWPRVEFLEHFRWGFISTTASLHFRCLNRYGRVIPPETMASTQALRWDLWWPKCCTLFRSSILAHWLTLLNIGSSRGERLHFSHRVIQESGMTSLAVSPPHQRTTNMKPWCWHAPHWGHSPSFLAIFGHSLTRLKTGCLRPAPGANLWNLLLMFIVILIGIKALLRDSQRFSASHWVSCRSSIDRTGWEGAEGGSGRSTIDRRRYCPLQTMRASDELFLLLMQHFIRGHRGLHCHLLDVSRLWTGPHPQWTLRPIRPISASKTH